MDTSKQVQKTKQKQDKFIVLYSQLEVCTNIHQSSNAILTEIIEIFGLNGFGSFKLLFLKGKLTSVNLILFLLFFSVI